MLSGKLNGSDSRLKYQKLEMRKALKRGFLFRKRPRESQVDLVQGLATRGRRKGLTMTQGFGRKERPDKRKDLHARIAMETIMVCVDE